MVSEDFSFPKISNPLPPFTALPSLWRVSSLIYPEFGDDNVEEGEKVEEPLSKSFPISDDDGDDNGGEKMDMLWEELESNEELKCSLLSRKEAQERPQPQAVMKIFNKKQSKSLLTVMKSLKIKMFYLRNLAWIKN